MRFHWDKKYLYWGITAFCVIVASVLFFFILFRVDEMSRVVRLIYSILEPIVYGLVIAYLVGPIMNFFEKYLLRFFQKRMKKTSPKKMKTLCRCLAIFISMILSLVAVSGLIVMVIPQLINSMVKIVENSSVYLANLQSWMSKILTDNPRYVELATTVFGTVSTSFESWVETDLLPRFHQLVTDLTTSVLSIFTVAKNLLVGLIVSVYVLYSKDLFAAQAKKILYACFGVKRANSVIRAGRYTHKVFGGFIVGKLLDSLIIGILCFIGMSIFRMPFALLISVIIGVTNVIPVFGPLIGAIPSAVIILLVDPMQCLYFVIFILVLQQFDGNVLGPKILGESTGLSCFWVIVAILVGSGLFGFVGMILSVPVFAVIYAGVSMLISRSLEKKKLATNTEEYLNLDHIDPACGEKIPLPEEKPSHGKKVFKKFAVKQGKNK